MPSPRNSAGPDLSEKLQQLVEFELGKLMPPERIFFLPALPHTRNAKVMRRLIRSAFLNEDPGDLSALENPDSIEAIQQIVRRETKRQG